MSSALAAVTQYNDGQGDVGSECKVSNLIFRVKVFLCPMTWLSDGVSFALHLSIRVVSCLSPFDGSLHVVSCLLNLTIFVRFLPF